MISWDNLAKELVDRLEEQKRPYTITRHLELGFHQIIICLPVPSPVGRGEKQHISICMDDDIRTSFYDLDYSSRGMCGLTYHREPGLADHILNEALHLLDNSSKLCTTDYTRDDDFYTYILARFLRANTEEFCELVYLCRDNVFPSREVLLAFAQLKKCEEKIVQLFKIGDAAQILAQ